jgi:DNA-binding phage protein
MMEVLKTVTTPYDVAEHLRSPVEMAAFLEACMEKAHGDAGLSRESLYKALSGERSPGFDTILKVIDALGLRLHAEAAQMAELSAQPGVSADVATLRG